jgi:hypothetical protein
MFPLNAIPKGKIPLGERAAVLVPAFDFLSRSKK